LVFSSPVRRLLRDSCGVCPRTGTKLARAARAVTTRRVVANRGDIAEMFDDIGRKCQFGAVKKNADL
jgi:hypothetical protein